MKFHLYPLSILFCAGMVTACHVNPHAIRQADPSDETLMASRAGGVVNLSDERVPNPTGLEGISTRSDRLISRYHPGAGTHCEGYLARQVAMTVVADEELSDARFSAHGDAEVLVIVEPAGNIRCEVASGGPVIAVRDWRPGTYRVYVGTTERNKNFTYDLTFEDFERPVTLPWLHDEEIPTVAIKDTMEEPGHIVVDTKSSRFSSRSARHGDATCSAEEATFPFHPSLRIVVEETAIIDLSALSDKETTVNLIGPIPENRRDIPTRCLSSQSSNLELEPGEYFVRLGVDDDATPENIGLVVRDSTATGAASFLATTPSEGLPVHARELRKHFPFATAENIWQDDGLRAQIFAEAPDELLVGIAQAPEDARAFDARPADKSAESAEEVTDEQADPEEIEPAEYRAEDVTVDLPQAGEVVLLIDESHVLTTDGLIFSVSRDVLVPAEDLNEITLPQTPRNPHLTLDEAIKRSADDEQDNIQAFSQVWADFQACRDGELMTIEAQLQEYEDNANFDAAEALVEETNETIREICEEDEAMSQKLLLWESLEDSRTQRRSLMLEENRVRIEALLR